jgi:phosphate transport system substrate-binding protein
MMPDDAPDIADVASRRQFLLASGATGTVLMAGCLGSGGSNSGGNSTNTGNSSNGQKAGETLKAGGSSTVYPITSKASSYWNANRPADDKEYWGPKQYGIDTSLPLADYWASLYFDVEKGGSAPFPVTVGLSHSGTGVTRLMNEQIDIGDSSAPVKAELPKRNSYENFTDHVVGVDGQPIVVSREIYEAGIKKIALNDLKAIYKGEIKNWSKLGGPNKSIQCLGRVRDSGTSTAFRTNVFGDTSVKLPGVDARQGTNQKLSSAIASSDNAISYLALAFVDPDGPVPPIGLKVDGKLYEYGKNLGAKEYPLSRDLHCYTWKGTSKQEAAFLRMIISDFGQKKFVVPNDYFKLPEKRQKKQLKKLPKTSK